MTTEEHPPTDANSDSAAPESGGVDQPEARLTALEKEAVLAAWEEEGRRGGPRDPQMFGCLIAFFGMAFLAVTPAVGSMLEIQPNVARTILMAGAGLLFLGALYPLLLRLIRGGTPELLECMAAARFLDANAGAIRDRLGSESVDPLVLQAFMHCARFLRGAYTVQGPSTTNTPGLGKATARLGEGRPILLAVERVLHREGGCYPVLIPPKLGGQLP